MMIPLQQTSFTSLSNQNYDSSVKGVLTPLLPEETTNSRKFSTYFSLPINTFEELFTEQKPSQKEKAGEVLKTKQKTRKKLNIKR